MARGSIVKRRSGNYAIVYYVDGKQRWETIGPSRREAERALTARKARGRHRHLARAEQRNPRLLRRTLARPPRSNAREGRPDAVVAGNLRRLPTQPPSSRAEPDR